MGREPRTVKKKWDVLIVGGGPAGSRAGEIIAARGFDVLILDRKKTIGMPNHCGEGLSIDCLEELGVSSSEEFILHEVEGSRIHFPNGSWIDFPKKGFCVSRPELDSFLAQRARSAGAVIRTGERVEAVSRRENGWSLRTTRAEYRGSFLLGAGGPLCPVAAHLGQRAPMISACQFKFPARVVMGEKNRLHFFHHEDFRGGYAWAFFRGDELSVGAGGAGRPIPMVESLCRKLGIDPETRLKTEGGPIPFLDRPLRIVFPRALLSGDAGGFIHPLTKGGIHGAVWSGKLAGECLARALETGREQELDRYRKLVSGHISRSRLRLRIPHAFLHFDNRIVNAIGDVMNGHDYTDLPVGRFLSVVVKNLSPHILWGLGIGIAVQRAYKSSEKFAW